MDLKINQGWPLSFQNLFPQKKKTTVTDWRTRTDNKTQLRAGIKKLKKPIAYRQTQIESLYVMHNSEFR